jgi:GAF domain-containing protein
MISLLVVSEQPSLLQDTDIAAIQPAPDIRQYDPEALAFLQAQDGPDSGPLLVLLDTTRQPDAPAACRALRQAGPPGGSALIAILADPAGRQAVLEAGADDYLLAPLSQAEVDARLQAHLQRLEMARQQEEAQVSASQIAFLMLIARLIGESPDLPTLLAQALEQTLTLLNAWVGELWLCSVDGERLDLASSLMPALSGHRPNHRAIHQGLIGWAAEQSGPLVVEFSPADGHFDRQVDLLCGKERYAVLATPLRQHDHLVGVLALYRKLPRTFTANDTALLVEIARSLTSAISNAQLVQDLRNTAARQQALYEMSQQISAGLDFQSTINYALQWINRLCDTEIGLLWLAGSASHDLRLTAALGAKVPPNINLKLQLENCLVKRVTSGTDIILINDPVKEYCDCLAIFNNFDSKPRNFMVIAMKYQNQLTGVITLLNKIGGSFEHADVQRLVTAVEMIAIAISNAQMHKQTLELVQEGERLHQVALRSERLATIGRLTASLAHEINNPLQAIRGAMALAQEDLHDYQSLAEYLSISLQEVERVIKLVQRMRQIYQPPLDKPETIDLNALLNDALAAARDELMRQQVQVQAEMEPDLGYTTGVANQLHLAFLGILLQIAEVLGASGGGKLFIHCRQKDSTAVFSFCTGEVGLDESAQRQVELASPTTVTGEQIPLEDLLGLSLARDLITAHNGSLIIDQNLTQACLRVTLLRDQPAEPLEKAHETSPHPDR